MALEGVQMIIGRAIMDPEFREQLKTDPDSVFATRNITPEEAEALKAMDWDSLEPASRDLDERVSRMALDMDTCK